MNSFKDTALSVGGLVLAGTLSGCSPRIHHPELPIHPIVIQATISDTSGSVVAILCRDSDGLTTRAEGWEKFPETTTKNLSSRGMFIPPRSGKNYDKNPKGTSITPGVPTLVLMGTRMVYDSRIFTQNPEFLYLEFITKGGVGFRYLAKNPGRISVITAQNKKGMDTLLSDCAEKPVTSSNPEIFEIKVG